MDVWNSDAAATTRKGHTLGYGCDLVFLVGFVGATRWVAQGESATRPYERRAFDQKPGPHPGYGYG